MRSRLLIGLIAISCIIGCNNNKGVENNPAILPVPKSVNLVGGNICFDDSIFIYSHPLADSLVFVLKEELMTMAGMNVLKTAQKESADWVISVDTSLKNEAYKIDIDKQVSITGGDYKAIAMGSVTVLQMMQIKDQNVCIPKGSVSDEPDLAYRGLLIDLARRKHDMQTIKNVVLLCRWYKINYLQLHLTDDQLFTFPSSAFPQVVTAGAAYTEKELLDLVEYSHSRGVELIPEFEMPGHSGQMIQKLPGLFGFTDKKLNRSTINMAKEEVYTALDTLIGEVARIFHHSKYIHMGGDETDFSGMEENKAVAAYLKKNELKNIHELYWRFINRINSFVKKRGKKTIVWEGFSKEANSIIDKDITVMAWETIYQMPQDLLAGGFNIINVSWKPLYVVNEKKWDPLQIYKWNIYRWANWVPKMPSYTPFQIPAHQNVMGAFMASWDQPAYTEISSLRKRIPAMVEKVWNLGSNMSDSTFLSILAKTNAAFSKYLSPVLIKVEGRSYPETEDGRYDEQTWFDDKVILSLAAPRNLQVRYTLNGSPVSSSSAIYKQPVELDTSTQFRYRAFNNDLPVGAEMLEYYEFRPLKIELKGKYTVSSDTLWETTRSWLIGYADSMQISIHVKRKGDIRYTIGKELNGSSPLYMAPISIKDTAEVKAGLFVGDSLIGKPWIQNFQKEK